MDELVKILSELHPDVDVRNHRGLVEDGILDSFDIVTIISEVADKFDVLIGAEEILPENFDSAESLYALIEAKRNA